MKHLLMTPAMRIAGLAGLASATSHRPARTRRPAWPELMPLGWQRHDAAAQADDPDADNSWFDSSRVLAQGLQVTEHHVGLEALLSPGG